MTSPVHDTDESLILLAQQATKDVERALGHDVWPATSALSRVVEALAERVAELTVEVRRTKPHHAQAQAGQNSYGTFRGVCSCGWRTDYEEHDRVVEWVAKHVALYRDLEPAP